MSTLVYMKLLELTPESYDRGMRILTLGKIDRIKGEIAERWVDRGDEVLEIGCGTGTLAALLVERGVRVLAIDISEPMLRVARAAAPGADFRHLTATEIHTLGNNRFDRVIATLALSELSADEVEHVLSAIAAALAPGGTLIIADEVRPRRWWRRVLAALLRWPLAALTFVLTRSTTHALREIDTALTRVGLRPLHEQRHLLGTLALIVAGKDALP